MASRKQHDTATGESAIYQLKITLKHISPPIWRRVQVQGHVTLHQLHEIIQDAMGWTNTHLHQFIIRRTFYGEPDADGVDYPYSEMENGKKFELTQVIARSKTRFVYEYDFGDGWEHEILVEDILPMESGKVYPVCLAGKRSCPPEDCGGPHGYGQLLESLGNPNHPDHKEMLERVGEYFHPEAFDLDETNEILAGLSRELKVRKPPRKLVAVK